MVRESFKNVAKAVNLNTSLLLNRFKIFLGLWIILFDFGEKNLPERTRTDDTIERFIARFIDVDAVRASLTSEKDVTERYLVWKFQEISCMCTCKLLQAGCYFCKKKNILNIENSHSEAFLRFINPNLQQLSIHII